MLRRPTQTSTPRSFDDLVAACPQLADIEHQALCWASGQHRPGEIWFEYERLKKQLKLLVGWYAVDERLESSRCYEVALHHMLDLLESGGGPMILDIARDYVAARICVIPIRADGSKAPAIRSWRGYQERLPTDEELVDWFSLSSATPLGLGIVCGAISCLEVLDFDVDADDTFQKWISSLTPAIRSKLCVVETGGLGFHVLYRPSVLCGNTKIAMRDDGEVLVESRGQGGYIVGVGSPLQVHSSCNPYVQTHGAPLPELPCITEEQRREMWAAAGSFDQRDQRKVLGEYARKRANKTRPRQPTDPDTPWGDFDQRASWAQVLIPAGWTSKDDVHWTRPGKLLGTSGKLCVAEDGCDVLTVFSANAGPLAPMGTGHRTWGKFNAFTALHHAGDRSAAARAVMSLGFGKRMAA